MRRWTDLIAWTCAHGQRAVHSSDLIVEVEAVALKSILRQGRRQEGGLASSAWHINEMARLIARTFGHGHRAVCGGGHHLEVVEEELALADNCLHIRQTGRAPENVNRANMESGGLASSAWHIDQMGPPYRSDVWAWAQSSVRWWSSSRGRGGGACPR